MKIIKLSLAALVIIVAAGTSAFKAHPKVAFFTTTWFTYSGAQNKTAYNTPTNYTKETGQSCTTKEPVLCEIAVTAITHTSLGAKTIPVLPAGTGTVISSANDGGTKAAFSTTYLVGTTTINVDFKL